MNEPRVPYGPPHVPSVDSVSAEPDVVLPTPATVARPAPAPRPVPLSYRVATFDISLIELFLGLFLLTAPLALVVIVPRVGAPLLVLVAAAVVVFRARRYLHRTALLRWGEVATVTGFDARLGSTRISNVPLRSAQGWTLTGGIWNGPLWTSDVEHELNGSPGRVRLRGRRYAGGVVLADSRDPSRAMVVSQVPYDLTPGPEGKWPGTLTTARWVGVALTLVLEAGLVLAAVAATVSAFS